MPVSLTITTPTGPYAELATVPISGTHGGLVGTDVARLEYRAVNHNGLVRREWQLLRPGGGADQHALSIGASTWIATLTGLVRDITAIDVRWFERPDVSAASGSFYVGAGLLVTAGLTVNATTRRHSATATAGTTLALSGSYFQDDQPSFGAVDETGEETAAIKWGLASERGRRPHRRLSCDTVVVDTGAKTWSCVVPVPARAGTYALRIENAKRWALREFDLTVTAAGSPVISPIPPDVRQFLASRATVVQLWHGGDATPAGAMTGGDALEMRLNGIGAWSTTGVSGVSDGAGVATVTIAASTIAGDPGGANTKVEFRRAGTPAVVATMFLRLVPAYIP